VVASSNQKKKHTSEEGKEDKTSPKKTGLGTWGTPHPKLARALDGKKLVKGGSYGRDFQAKKKEKYLSLKSLKHSPRERGEGYKGKKMRKGTKK